MEIHLYSSYYDLDSTGQYGEVHSALYRPSPGSAPIKVAVKKTKVSKGVAPILLASVHQLPHRMNRTCATPL